MTPTAVIAALQERGITLTANGDKLAVNVQRGTLAPNVKAYLAEHKAELLAALQDPGAECGAIYDAWLADPAPDDAAWARRYADAAIRAGLPYYGADGVTDMGAGGWYLFAAEAVAARPAETMTRTVNLGALAGGEYATAMNGLTAIKSEWPIDAPNPILTATAEETKPETKKAESEKRQTTIFEQAQIEKPKKGEDEMGIKIEQTKYTVVPTGEYPARIKAVEQDEKGVYGPQLKVKFELIGPGDLAGNTLTGWCSAKFCPKSKLYEWTRAAFGRDIPATWTFDSDKLLEKLVTLVIVVKEKDDGTEYSKVERVKSLARPAAVVQPAPAAVTAAAVAVPAQPAGVPDFDAAMWGGDYPYADADPFADGGDLEF